MTGPRINTSVLSSYVYVLIICVSSGGLGSWLVFICRDSLSMPSDTIGLVRVTCFISGVVMMVFVASWFVFMAMSITSSSAANKKKEQNCGGLETDDDFCYKRTLYVVFGRLCFLMLLLTCMVELTSLGFIWWSSFSLASKYQVTSNCFCHVLNETVSNSEELKKQVQLNLDVVNVSCPGNEESLLKCVAIYDDIHVEIGQIPITVSVSCKKLDDPLTEDIDCRKYSDFWLLFKILRIILPLMSVIKLPFLILNCASGYFGSDNLKPSRSGNVNKADEAVKSPLKLLESKRRTSNNSSGKIKLSPYFGTRLAPLGEENEDRDISIKKNKKNNVIGALLSQNQCEKTPLRRKASVDQVDYEDEVFSADSPGNSLQNTISTPVHEGMTTPSFDLSKVIKPVFRHSLNENDFKHPASPPVSAPPISTFRSTFPAVLREKLEAINIDADICESIESRSVKKKIPSVIVASYHPPVAPSFKLNEVQGATNRNRLSSLPPNGECSITNDADSALHQRFSTISRCSMNRNSPLTPNIEEISNKARSRSAASANINWNKLP